MDGAEVYKTEPELGIAIKESGVDRSKLYVTTVSNLTYLFFLVFVSDFIFVSYRVFFICFMVHGCNFLFTHVGTSKALIKVLDMKLA